MKCVRFYFEGILKVKEHIQLLFHVFWMQKNEKNQMLSSMNEKMNFFADMPIVTLKMGSSLNPDDIKEGADVYFECLILSNPKPYKMSWFHNVSVHWCARKSFWGCSAIAEYFNNFPFRVSVTEFPEI